MLGEVNGGAARDATAMIGVVIFFAVDSEGVSVVVDLAGEASAAVAGDLAVAEPREVGDDDEGRNIFHC
jgi:hypothetical protein